MKKTQLVIALSTLFALPTFAQNTMIDGMDFGPLAQLVGTWKSVETGGVDLSPGQEGTDAGKGGLAVTPFYEVMTFEVAADATNASEQYLVALYYKQEVFRKVDDSKFHDQRGYFIYDRQNQVVYNSFCVPRTTCITAEGEAGDSMHLIASPRGIAESEFMTKNAKTTDFVMNISIEGKQLVYSQTTNLDIYNSQFSHTDTSTLIKVE